MDFFDKFKIIEYQVTPELTSQAVNIMAGLVARYSNIENTTLFFYHMIMEGQRPEDVAYEFYDDTTLHWIILLLNGVVDPYFQWGLTQQELDSMIRDKYDDANGIHHFENLITNRIVDQYDSVGYQADLDNSVPLPQHISPVTNTQYEFEKNVETRQIKVLDPRHVDEIVSQFNDLMRVNP